MTTWPRHIFLGNFYSQKSSMGENHFFDHLFLFFRRKLKMFSNLYYSRWLCSFYSHPFSFHLIYSSQTVVVRRLVQGLQSPIMNFHFSVCSVSLTQTLGFSPVLASAALNHGVN